MSTRIYQLLLRLYPREFRQRWEEEMVETFTIQVSENWFCAWRCAVPELLLAAPERLSVPLLSLAASGVLLSGLTWALTSSPVLVALYHRLIAKFGG